MKLLHYTFAKRIVSSILQLSELSSKAINIFTPPLFSLFFPFFLRFRHTYDTFLSTDKQIYFIQVSLRIFSKTDWTYTSLVLQKAFKTEISSHADPNCETVCQTHDPFEITTYTFCNLATIWTILEDGKQILPSFLQFRHIYIPTYFSEHW